MNEFEQRSPWIRTTKQVLPFAIVLAFLVLLLTYERPIGSLISAKSDARKSSELWNVPQPLQLESSQPTAGRMLCYFGYQFKSPWTDVIAERKIDKVAALTFSGGQGIAIFDESKTLTGRAGAGQTENKQIDQMAGHLFGYAFRSKILNATPADLHGFSSRQRMASSSTYIAIKSLDARYMKGGLYSFQTPGFRGFQIGSPSSSASQDEQIMIEFYDRKISKSGC
jgi:hypothetical protein